MIQPVKLTYGADPEVFVHRDGHILGSEKVLSKEGIFKQVVRDGVQVEFNPFSGDFPRELGVNVGRCVAFLYNHLTHYHPGVNISFDSVVDVTEIELRTLSPEYRVLGCVPSKNAYGDRPVNIDGRTYLKRSGGGHLHFGLTGLPSLLNLSAGIDERQRIVPLLDVFVGNTCVLFDRDPWAAERRKAYGRAGEYRDDKPYGVEYRTLSNFWLKGYPLLSLACGMGNFAIAVAEDAQMGDGAAYQELLNSVDIDAFIYAIDNNDFDQAKKNFEFLVPFFQKYLPESGFPVTPKNLDHVLTLADAVHKNGLEVYMVDDPVAHWLKLEHVEFDGWLGRLF